MAIRNKPYLPLYVNDFMSDEKLLMCSAEATGVYIRLMCLMHKSSQYGKILLQQMHKKTPDAITNFASVLTKQLPFEFPCVKRSLEELLSYNIITMENDELVQKRMVKDAEISEKRATSGQKGGFATANSLKSTFATANAKAKVVANSDIDIDIGIVNKEGNENQKITEPPKPEIIQMNDYTQQNVDDLYKSYISPEYTAIRENLCIARHITMEHCLIKLKEFTQMLKGKGELKKTMKDYMGYFFNWLGTQKPESKTTEKNEWQEAIERQRAKLANG